MLRSLILVSVLTACASSSSSDPDWKFGAAEAESSLAGKWAGTFTAGAKTGSIDLDLALAAPTATPKCGSRTLGLAPKCIDVTTVRLVGTLTTSDGAFNAAAVSGALEVFSTTLSSGQLELKTADGKTLTAQYQPSTFKDGRLALASGEATFTLARR